MFHGIMNVYKEAGFTSHDVVAKLRGICKQKKIGHTGTLDPDAVGVLPVCLGNGTKLCDMLTDKTKEYVAEFQLGIVTDTQDISGQVLQKLPVTVTPEEVRKVMHAFQGELQQVPPMYSALKVNGKKLYELAREGKEVERKPRAITIFELELLEEKHPQYQIRVKCSKGTYIRTLCHDIGQALGCGAVMTSLTRTRVGEFTIENAYRLSEIEQMAGENQLSQIITPVEDMFLDLCRIETIHGAGMALHNGNQLPVTVVKTEKQKDWLDGEQCRTYDESGKFCGIYEYQEERRLFTPVKMFL